VQVQCCNVGKRYQSAVVLSALNLHVESGEFLAIIGASGAGKSTALRLLAGLETPDDGRILIDGRQLTGLNKTARVMFQDARLLPWKRVVDNVALALQPGDRKKAMAALEMVGLETRARDWPSILSGGQQQRVALARALATRPRLMLLDEPLGSLDALTRIEMQRLIEKIWLREQFSAVLVTHDCAEAITLADRVVMLDQGRVAMELRVPLPRPRERAAGLFPVLEGRLLRRILSRPIGTLNSTDISSDISDTADSGESPILSAAQIR
jgi:sulfonate transport system ATP-binding protein